MKLYVCYGTFKPAPRPGGHPCGNAYHALKDAGHEPEVIRSSITCALAGASRSELLDEICRPRRSVIGLRPALKLGRPPREARLRQRPPDGEPERRRGQEPPRKPDADACPVRPRRVLGHVA